MTMQSNNTPDEFIRISFIDEVKSALHKLMQNVNYPGGIGRVVRGLHLYRDQDEFDELLFEPLYDEVNSDGVVKGWELTWEGALDMQGGREGAGVGTSKALRAHKFLLEGYYSYNESGENEDAMNMWVTAMMDALLVNVHLKQENDRISNQLLVIKGVECDVRVGQLADFGCYIATLRMVVEEQIATNRYPRTNW